VELYRPGELAVRATSSRPATAIVHDVPDVRMLVFRIAPGQSVPLHTNAATVILTVLEGHGRIAGADGEQPVTAGNVIAFAPHEPHGMRAIDTEFTLVATISPNPSARTGVA
jgi:quercetin dioxygenase-like cupin family protein